MPLQTVASRHTVCFQMKTVSYVSVCIAVIISESGISFNSFVCQIVRPPWLQFYRCVYQAVSSHAHTHVAPFTQPVQGWNCVPLLCAHFLYKTYKQGMRRHCCSTSKPAAEVVTKPNRHLCKKKVNQQDGTGVWRFDDVLCVRPTIGGRFKKRLAAVSGKRDACCTRSTGTLLALVECARLA